MAAPKLPPPSRVVSESMTKRDCLHDECRPAAPRGRSSRLPGLASRRMVLTAGAALLFPWPQTAAAEGTDRIYRLGLLGPNVSPLLSDVFRAELVRFGFHEGRNLLLERWVGGASALPSLAQQALAWRPDAMVAISGIAIVAMRTVSSTVPIIGLGADPVVLGIADSTADPGGNVTGISIANLELEPKRLQLLAEAVPDRHRVGVLMYAGQPAKEVFVAQIEKAGRSLGLDLVIVETSGLDGYAAAFRKLRDERAEALLITAQAIFFRDVDALVRLAGELKLPSICEWPDMTHSGCVLAYGPNRSNLYRRMAAMAVMVLRGAKPSTIPIEQPSELVLNINLQAARSLGVGLPPSLVARAGEVIE